MSREWLFYLEDIRDSALKVLRYTEGMDIVAFQENEQAFDAVVRNLEVIGEAAKHLPDEAKAMMPEIEWSKAAAFRDIIVHHYFGLDIRILWDVVQTKVPDIARISAIILAEMEKGE